MDVPLPATRPPSRPAPLARAAGLVVCVAVHALFAATVWRLFWFLGGTHPGSLGAAGARLPAVSRLAVDALLALQFALPHSLLLHPATRKLLRPVAPGPFYGLLYAAVTCLSLQMMFLLWMPVGGRLWAAHGVATWLVYTAYALSWVALVHSLHLTGLGFQTGFTPWLAWFQGRPAPRREFAPRGAYRWMRHPAYLSFLGLVWFSPVMTIDHAVLTAIWTAYIAFGSWLKDRRLEQLVGPAYREYESRVAGYPLLPFGPLARRPLAPGGFPGTDPIAPVGGPA